MVSFAALRSSCEAEAIPWPGDLIVASFVLAAPAPSPLTPTPAPVSPLRRMSCFR